MRLITGIVPNVGNTKRKWLMARAELKIKDLVKGQTFEGDIYEGHRPAEVHAVLMQMEPGKIIPVPGTLLKLKVLECTARNAVIGISRGYKIKLKAEVI
jgi:hypothetical protein